MKAATHNEAEYSEANSTQFKTDKHASRISGVGDFDQDLSDVPSTRLFNISQSHANLPTMQRIPTKKYRQ